MNERGQRISGLRARAIEASLVMPILLAACGGDKPQTTQTPVLPTEQPTPSIMINPTPEVTIAATPTPEVTPIPTPEATLPTLKGMIETNPAKIDNLKTFVATTTADINTVLANNPSAIRSTGTTAEYYKNFWNDCQKANTDQGKEFSCEDLIGTMWYNYNNIEPKDQGFFNVIQEIYDYAGNTLSQKYFDILKQNLASL